jgi:hypothetical protein
MYMRQNQVIVCVCVCVYDTMGNLVWKIIHEDIVMMDQHMHATNQMQSLEKI